MFFCCQNDAPVQQEQTEQETLEKITRELQENGWQLLFNGLTIRRDSVDTSRRIVRLECLNHIRQELDKLYALESALDNCPPKLQPLSSRDMLRNEECQQSQHQLEQKTTDSWAYRERSLFKHLITPRTIIHDVASIVQKKKIYIISYTYIFLYTVDIYRK